MNLYDLTKGSYRVVRIISYPDFPESQIVTVTNVKAARNDWKTDISMNGTYSGPADITSVKDYKAVWSQNGKDILESGAATLVTSSGRSVRQVWSSVITPRHRIKKFPATGELLDINISPLEIKGNTMKYQWEGMVKQRRYIK